MADTELPPAAAPVLLPALRPAVGPAVQPLTHARYRVVGVATAAGIVAGAGIALLGVTIGLTAQRGPTVVVEATAPGAGGGVRIDSVPALAPDQRLAATLDAPGPVWASRAIAASSQWSDTSWSMQAALGPPDTYPRHGDINTAWASRAPDADSEFLEVGFDRPRRIRGVIVVETFNPGAITTITAGLAGGGRQVLIHQAVSPMTALGGELAAQQRRFELPGCTADAITSIRIDLDSAAVAGWNELDAVGVIPCD